MFEEAITYVLMIAVGLPAVTVAILRGDRFSGASTLCLALVALGARGLVRISADRKGLPAARARAAVAVARDHHERSQS